MKSHSVGEDGFESVSISGQLSWGAGGVRSRFESHAAVTPIGSTTERLGAASADGRARRPQ
jgi:hypothetical protein